jgi:hypothetical protein
MAGEANTMKATGTSGPKLYTPLLYAGIAMAAAAATVSWVGMSLPGTGGAVDTARQVMGLCSLFMLAVAILIPVMLRRGIDRHIGVLAADLHHALDHGAEVIRGTERDDAIGALARAGAVLADTRRQRLLEQMVPQAPTRQPGTALPEAEHLLRQAILETTNAIRESHRDMQGQLHEVSSGIGKLAETVQAGTGNLKHMFEHACQMAEESGRTVRNVGGNLQDALNAMRDAERIAVDMASLSRGHIREIEQVRQAAVDLERTRKALEEQAYVGTTLITDQRENLSLLTGAISLIERNVHAIDSASHRLESGVETQVARLAALQGAPQQMVDVVTAHMAGLDDKLDAAIDRRIDPKMQLVARGIVDLQNSVRDQHATAEALSRSIEGTIADMGRSLEDVLEPSIRATLDQRIGPVVAGLDQLQRNALTARATEGERLKVFAAHIGSVAERVETVIAPAVRLAQEAMATKTGTETGVDTALADLAAKLTQRVDELAEASKANHQQIEQATDKMVTSIGDALEEMKSRQATGGRAISDLPPVPSPLLAPNASAVMVGFQVLLRSLSADVTRLHQAVTSVETEAEGIKTETASGLSRMLERIHAVAERLEAQAKSTVTSNATPASPTAAEMLQPATLRAMETFETEKGSLQKVLVGFRMLMRDISQENDRYRETITGMAERAPADANASPMTLDASAMAAFESRIDQLGETLFDCVFSLEEKLGRPVEARLDAVSHGVAEVLTSIESRVDTAIGKLDDMRATLQLHQAAPAASGAAAPPAIHSVVTRMEAVGESLDGRIADFTHALADIQTALLRQAPRGLGERERVQIMADANAIALGMKEAASTLQEQTGEFLAIGAALSKEIADMGGTAKKSGNALDRGFPVRLGSPR